MARTQQNAPAGPHAAVYYDALRDANEMLMECDGLEPTSAIKQAASDRGIPFGDEMGKFVRWANAQWGI